MPADAPIPDEHDALTAQALKAMAHPLRWKILCTLGDSELHFGDIVALTGTSPSNISRHLEQLRSKRILTSRKEGNRVFYRIRNGQLVMLIATMRNVLCPANLEGRLRGSRQGGGD
ncbi:MAG: metalloregulator ArsR/SmtB family transcription factor [Gammaproteobacteria bacterium]|jgi:DNA-binding transcriptional ArsR family regulator